MESSSNERTDANKTPLLSWANALLIIATLAALSGVLALLRCEAAPGIEISLPTTTPTPRLMVYVSGAVAQPGVYEFRDGDRLQDAVQSAGGLLSDADTSAVNMAALLEDEQHYHFPLVGESNDRPTANLDDSTASDNPSHGIDEPPQSLENPIDINSASQQQLQSLPGIGEVKSRAIIDFRNAHGPFSEISEITSVPGIGPVIFENIQNLITVNFPNP